ncbi:MAG: LEA type 2 family protein [Bdellovibrionota bacterium]
MGEPAPSSEAPPPAASPSPKKRRLALSVALAVGGGLIALALLVFLLTPKLSIAGFEIVQTRDTHFEFVLKLAVQNRLPFNIEISDYAFQLDLNGSEVARGHAGGPTTIAGWEETHVPVSVSGYEKDLPEFLQMGRHAPPLRREYAYKLTGWVQIDSPIHHRYEFVREGELPAFSMPDIMIHRIGVTRFDLFQPEMVLELEVTNPNGFEISQEKFISDVIINGIPVGKVDSPNRVTYKPQDVTIVPFNFRMESIRGAASMLTILQRGEVIVHVKGSLMVETKEYGKLPFAFDKEGPAPVFLQNMGMPGMQR